jgi:hypothetical protein
LTICAAGYVEESMERTVVKLRALDVDLGDLLLRQRTDQLTKLLPARGIVAQGTDDRGDVLCSTPQDRVALARTDA